MNFRTILTISSISLLGACASSGPLKLGIPDAFREQSNMEHVNGARKNKMSFGNFSTSKIKRGMHVTYPGWGKGFFLENLYLNQVGIQKNEVVTKEKDKYRYTLTNGSHTAEVFAKEMEIKRSLKYRLGSGNGILNNYERLQQYQYVFSAQILTDAPGEAGKWELLMSNIYDRKKEGDTRIFTILKQDDNGLATNGVDTFYIRGLSLKKTESPSGRTAYLPFQILSGYEVSTSDGVVAIIDLIDKNIWFYNELETAEKLTIGAVGTAIFARRVKDSW